MNEETNIPVPITTDGQPFLVHDSKGSKKKIITFQMKLRNQKKAEHKKKATEFRAAWTMGLIVGSLILCYTPLVMVMLFGAIADKALVAQYANYIAYPIADTMFHLNSSFSPIIYCLRTEVMKRIAIKVLCCRGKWNQITYSFNRRSAPPRPVA